MNDRSLLTPLPPVKSGLAVMNGEAMRRHLKLVLDNRWRDVRREMPDADTTVLVACPYENEPVWLGYWAGEHWFNVEGNAVVVTHWRHLPEPPDWKGRMQK